MAAPGGAMGLPRDEKATACSMDGAMGLPGDWRTTTSSMDGSEGCGRSSSIWSDSSVSAPPVVIMASSQAVSCAVGNGNSHTGEPTNENENADTASSSLPRRRGMKRGWKDSVGAAARAYQPGRISPLQEALSSYNNRDDGPIIVPRIGLEFDSCEEAFDFYNLYSWEGAPTAGAKKSIKQGCPVFIRLHRTDDDGWYIHDFASVHNHALSETCGEKKCWKSHRQIDPHTRELIKNLRANNVSLTKVYCLVKGFFGGNSMSPMTKRSLRNLCWQINKENAEDDVQKTVQIFNRMHEGDSGFANVVELDVEGRIKNMMWTNGKSRHDYMCFGDAITFDTTYKTNKYNMPFGLFVGVNNHFQSIIFAGVLMRDETIESFEWVFTQFVMLMGGKAPKTILTDQCRAMEVALANKFPDVKHRWCKWHVFQTIKAELGQKHTKEFKKELNKVCNHMLTREEFESAWQELMARHGLVGNVYMENIYATRHMWAKAYFMGDFCAKQTSTQRSESANHVLKAFVPPGAPMNVFVVQYHNLLADWIEKEDQKNHDDKMPLKGTMTGWAFEKHAAEFYTRTMLGKFVEHIRSAAAYDITEVMPNQLYRLDHVDAEHRESWARVTYMVKVKADGSFYQCECGLWEHMGMLCSHSIRVMMRLMVRRIPEDHLLRRWSREGNKFDGGNMAGQSTCRSLKMSRTFRNASLSQKANELVECGDLNIECYDICYKGMCELIEQIQSRNPNADGLGREAQVQLAERLETAGCSLTAGGGLTAISMCGPLQLSAITPDSARPSGRPSNARDRPRHELQRTLTSRVKRCKNCRGTGHGADRCPERDPLLQKPRDPSRCTRCRMTGHTRLNCGKLADAMAAAN